MIRGTKVKVSDTAKHHAGREGTFQFLVPGGNAVIKDPAKSQDGVSCCFTANLKDVIDVTLNCALKSDTAPQE